MYSATYHLWPLRLCHVFSTLSHKRHDFPGLGGWVGVGAVHEQKMCVLIFFYNLGVKRFLILGSVQRDSVLNVRYFCRFLVILIFAN